jgi:hypothetical protein
MNKYYIKVIGYDRLIEHEITAESFMLHNGIIQFITYLDPGKQRYDTIGMFPIDKTVIHKVERLEAD